MKKPKHQLQNARAQIEHTLRSELTRVQHEVDAAFNRYKSERDPALAVPLMNQWMRLVAQLTALAKAAPKADLEASQTLLKSGVDATWSRLLTELRKTLEALPRRVASLPV